MKKAMREHWRSCGRVEGFLNTYAQLSTGKNQNDMAWVLWLYCDYCPLKKNDSEPPSSDDLGLACPDQCELSALFVAGWQEGQEQAQQALETGDVALFEEMGRISGLTSRRPPRNKRRYTPQRDGVDGELHGEALKHYVRGWRQTGRRTKGI